MCVDCRRGDPCATCLAETRPGHVSTIHCGSSIAQFPETDGQTLTASAAREAYYLGLRVLGLDPAAF